ncbi:histidine--tRNA ligase [Candidatus Gracilibacteria bacterium CG17_big_fil_post_rev_8_21_14_2_50_48_13]|nr:MAG: histidine--tRNA ligase [Candidatus Gracilibacteria bacterium CG17_big_fil_post_rev_8_21_14_2_50_48_13]
MLSKEPYKGTRDFYPEDQFVHNHIFGVIRRVVEGFGYQEYNAPMLEETALYAAKTGEEIVGEQTYSFTDRGDRQVTMRPEMTPSFARMIARKRHELAFPARWYSIPNLWRYERPQRGRLREHWQLNVDIAGVNSIHGELEVITTAVDIMRGLGAKDDEFEVRINSRRFVEAFFADILGLDETRAYRLAKLIDKKAKISEEQFAEQGRSIVGTPLYPLFASCMEAGSIDELCRILPLEFATHPSIQELGDLFALLGQGGVGNARFDPTIMRGFDYYTGVVFEVFDKHPDNNRAMFGGGRYDGLVGIFGVEPISCVGIAMGDVTAYNFLEVRGLLPKYESNAKLYLSTGPGATFEEVWAMAVQLRGEGIAVCVELDNRKLEKQLKAADKLAVPYIAVIGGDEVASGMLKLKSLTSGAITEIGLKDLPAFLQKN